MQDRLDQALTMGCRSPRGTTAMHEPSGPNASMATHPVAVRRRETKKAPLKGGACVA